MASTAGAAPAPAPKPAAPKPAPAKPAKAGAGKPNEALAMISKLKGPDGFALFKIYNSALIADMAGQKDKAAAFYQSALEDRPSLAAAPDTYERLIEA